MLTKKERPRLSHGFHKEGTNGPEGETIIMAVHPIYQFRAELCDYKPKIWRTFQVANNISIARLGYILMSMFEMEASHLFSFEVPEQLNFNNYLHWEYRNDMEMLAKLIDEAHEDEVVRFELEHGWMDYPVDDNQKTYDAAENKIKDIVRYYGDQMRFTYDFGDGWHIHLILEDIIIDKDLPGKELPRVLEGEGYGIIEDCGGVVGLKEIATAFKSKKGRKYEELCEWLGVEEMDLLSFDIEDANLRVKKIPRIYTDIYENGLEPTKNSIDFLERKYKK